LETSGQVASTKKVAAPARGSRWARRGGEHDGTVVRHLVELVDEDRAWLRGFRRRSDVHDLVADIDAAVRSMARSTIRMARSTPAQSAGCEQDRERFSFLDSIMKTFQRGAGPSLAGLRTIARTPAGTDRRGT